MKNREHVNSGYVPMTDIFNKVFDEIFKAEEPAEPGSKLSAKREEELKTMLEGMRGISHNFYLAAIYVGNHAFIEFTGLMNEYIKVCEQTLADGKDFAFINTHADSGDTLSVQDYNIAYLQEKLNCIFDNACTITLSKVEADNGAEKK